MFGGVGAGKSTLANFLLDGYDSNKCKASETTEGGETKTISKNEGKALCDGQPVIVFDLPGLTDPDLPI